MARDTAVLMGNIGESGGGLEPALDYNNAVVRRSSGGKSGLAGGPSPPHSWLENIGLIVIVVLIIALTLTRYWRYIHWSVR
jgi:hypothetical protein